MKITIDTTVDSKEDIRKVLHALMDTNSPSQIVHEEPKQETQSFANMFSQQQEPAKEPVQDTAPDFSSFLNLAQTQEQDTQDKPKPKIEFF